MASDPHPPRIDKTSGYWFTRWYSDERDSRGRLKCPGKKFGHSSKVTKADANRKWKAWLIKRAQMPEGTLGNTVGLLSDQYEDHARVYYRRPDGSTTGEHDNVHAALKYFKGLFASLDAQHLRPRHLKEYQDLLIQESICRTTIVKWCNIIKRMLEWAVAEEYVTSDIYGAIAVVPHPAPGRTAAIEPEKVQPIDVRTIAKTLRQVSPIIGTMMRLQWLTGMRPGEVCGLTPVEIDRTRSTWLYAPSQHKTAHRQKQRVIAFGPKARKLIEPYLFRDPQTPCFSPRENVRHINARRRAGGKCGVLEEPSKVARLKDSYHRIGIVYTTKSYGDAIERACRKADVVAWTPNRIRHSAADRADRRGGRDDARRLLGHTDKKTTEIYITEDVRMLMEMAERAG